MIADSNYRGEPIEEKGVEKKQGENDVTDNDP